MYEGQFLEGKEHGKGTFSHKKEGVHKGNWEHGVPTGVCSQTMANGDMYEGSLEKGRRHGEGLYTWWCDEFPPETQPQYEGELKNDKFAGTGSFSCPLQELSYTGTWQENLPHGQGELCQATGGSKFEYKGDWKHGHKHGNGTMIWPGEQEFTGSFVKDRRQGPGTHKWSNGHTFQGNFENDER